MHITKCFRLSTDLHISQAKWCELENQGCRNGGWGDISAGHGSVYLDGRSHKFHRISAVIHTPARHRDAAGYYGRALSFQQKHYHTLPMSFVSISVMNGTLSMGTSTITSSFTRYQQCCNIRMVLIRHLSLHGSHGHFSGHSLHSCSD